MSVPDAALSKESISAAGLSTGLPAGVGAVVAFEGRVRRTNDGREVTGLHYDAYPEMADTVFADILVRARQAHPIPVLRVRHRTGTLDVGEVAVAVVAGAPHRDAAFEAARFVIEAVKAELPIWKREHYADGTSRWLDGHRPRGSG